jgi:phosphonate transport system ATP-binding protein
LSVSFGDNLALRSASLSVAPGEFLGVIGRSGAGKSTLLRAINRLAPVSGGQILSDGVDVLTLKGRGLRAWRASAAMIFQQYHLVGRLDVVTNVLIGATFTRPLWRTLLKAFTPADCARALLMLERVGMEEAALQRVDTLSGGQQQRVAIARALMQQPRLILADEPIASLDPVNADAVMQALQAINREDKIPVIASLHDLDYARTYCDRIVGVSKGTVVFDGPPAALDNATEALIYSRAPAPSFTHSPALQAELQP